MEIQANQQSPFVKINFPAGKSGLVLGRGGDGEGAKKRSAIMSGGKPVFLFVMYSPRAHIRWGSVHRVASCPREETSFSRRSRSLVRVGQVRMARWNVSGPVS